MKISTEIATLAKLVGEEKAVELYAKAGFDAWDFSLFDMARFDWATNSVVKSGHPLEGSNAISFARHLKKIGLDNGIVCNQSHAPFPISVKELRNKLPLALECTAEAGGRICVIHPDNNKTPEQNAEMYFELLPTAKSFGVKIATENMWNWDNQNNHACFAACSNPESFLAHINAVNDEYLVACLDIGHAEMYGLETSAVQMIKALGSHLQALHIHDNDLLHDSHQIPFSMKIDFNAVVEALKENNYDGYFTLEADRFLSAYNRDNAFDGAKQLALSAKKLVELYNKI